MNDLSNCKPVLRIEHFIRANQISAVLLQLQTSFSQLFICRGHIDFAIVDVLLLTVLIMVSRSFLTEGWGP